MQPTSDTSPSHAGIDGVFIQPDLRRRRIAVSVAASMPGRIRLHVEGTPYSAEGEAGELAVEMPDFEMWSPESPRLYTLIAELDAGDGGNSRVDTRFGMREFTIKDNRFHLNNRPVFIKGVVHVPAQAAADTRGALAAAKAAGFNLIRTRGNAPSSALLDCCDELGMLVYQELAHPDDALRRTILRDRNHACVAIWGMLNEGHGAEEYKDALCRAARALDPSRVIIDDSGGANRSREASRFMRPYRDELEPYDDFHIYQRAPVDQDIERYFRHNGQPGAMCFLSEFGFGGADECAAALDAIAPGFNERGLERVFSGMPGFLAATRELQADAARHQVDAVRANPKFGGYCYAQLAGDDSERYAGLLDSAHRPKPVLETFKKLHQPLRPLIQMPRVNLVPREQTPVTVLLLNEARLEKTMDISLQVVGPTNQVLWKKRRAVKLPKSGKELWTGSIGASGSIGTHKFVVRLLDQNRIVAENSIEFHVLKDIAPAEVAVHVFDSGGVWSKRIAPWAKIGTILSPIHIIPPFANTIRAYGDNDLAQILAQVEGGAVAIFFAPPADWNDLADKLDATVRATAVDAVGGARPVAHYVKLHPIFEGLPSRCLMRQPYRNIVAPRSFAESGDEDICGSFNAAAPEASAWGNDLLIKRLGGGRLVFTHLRVLENLDDPAAQRLFVNMLTHFARRSVPPDALQAPNKEAVEWLRRERNTMLRKWMLIGEFPNWNQAGHDTPYPPEQELNFAATYPGWYKAISWQEWHALAGEDPEDAWRVDMQAAFSPIYQAYPRYDYGVGYAYAEFGIDKRVDVSLRIGMANATKVWLNGTLVHEGKRQMPPGQFAWERATATTRQGKNTVLVKCTKTPGPFAFALDVEPSEREPLPIKWWR